jgi:hypothetical protein
MARFLKDMFGSACSLMSVFSITFFCELAYSDSPANQIKLLHDVRAKLTGISSPQGYFDLLGDIITKEDKSWLLAQSSFQNLVKEANWSDGVDFIRLRIRGTEFLIRNDPNDRSLFFINKIQFRYRPFAGAKFNIEELQHLLNKNQTHARRLKLLPEAEALPPLIGIPIALLAGIGAYVLIGSLVTIACDILNPNSPVPFGLDCLAHGVFWLPAGILKVVELPFSAIKNVANKISDTRMSVKLTKPLNVTSMNCDFRCGSTGRACMATDPGSRYIGIDLGIETDEHIKGEIRISFIPNKNFWSRFKTIESQNIGWLSLGSKDARDTVYWQMYKDGKISSTSDSQAAHPQYMEKQGETNGPYIQNIYDLCHNQPLLEALQAKLTQKKTIKLNEVDSNSRRSETVK